MRILSFNQEQIDSLSIEEAYQEQHKLSQRINRYYLKLKWRQDFLLDELCELYNEVDLMEIFKAKLLIRVESLLHTIDINKLQS